MRQGNTSCRLEAAKSRQGVAEKGRKSCAFGKNYILNYFKLFFFTQKVRWINGSLLPLKRQARYLHGNALPLLNEVLQGVPNKVLSALAFTSWDHWYSLSKLDLGHNIMVFLAASCRIWFDIDQGCDYFLAILIMLLLACLYFAAPPGKHGVIRTELCKCYCDV